MSRCSASQMFVRAGVHACSAVLQLYVQANGKQQNNIIADTPCIEFSYVLLYYSESVAF